MRELVVRTWLVPLCIEQLSQLSCSSIPWPFLSPVATEEVCCLHIDLRTKRPALCLRKASADQRAARFRSRGPASLLPAAQPTPTTETDHRRARMSGGASRLGGNLEWDPHALLLWCAGPIHVMCGVARRVNADGRVLTPLLPLLHLHGHGIMQHPRREAGTAPGTVRAWSLIITIILTKQSFTHLGVLFSCASIVFSPPQCRSVLRNQLR